MGDEPQSRSVEMEFFKAVLNSKNESDFSENVLPAIERFIGALERVSGITGKVPTVVPVESWKELIGSDRVWLPLSEVDVKRGIHYVYGPAVRDMVVDPNLGPFYVLTWELLIGTVLVSLERKLSLDPLGALAAGVVVSAVLNFDGEANAISADSYLKKLHASAFGLIEAAKRTMGTFPQENTPSFDFHVRAGYQLTFDALSLWTAGVMRAISGGIVSEKLLGREIITYILSEPQVNVGVFHTKGLSMTKLIDDPLGKDLATMTMNVTELVLYAGSYPRFDDDFTQMFR